MDCPAPNHPDDMYLGAVAKRLEWGVVHSPLFHQVRMEYLFLLCRTFSLALLLEWGNLHAVVVAMTIVFLHV